MINLLSGIFVMFILIATGYICKKIRIISNNMNQDIINLLVNVSLPALIIISLTSLSFTQQLLHEIFLLVVITFSMHLIFIGFSYIQVKLLHMDGADRDIYQFAYNFGNTGLIGFAVAYAIYGQPGLFYMAVCDAVSPVFVWTIGVMMMQRSVDKPEKLRGKGYYINLIKQIINPSMIAVIIGFFLLAMSIELPETVFSIIQQLGNLTIPLAMIFIGSIIGDMNLRVIYKDTRALYYCLQKLITLPLIIFAILWLLNFENYLLSIPVIYAAMPAGALTSIIASRYGNDYHLASKIILISTLISMITIPMIIWALLT